MTSESGIGILPADEQPGMFSRVSAGRVSDLIVEQIRLLIRDGKIKAGDRLPSERELGERFGVSRVTVREALKMLEANGLVTIRVGARGGAFVTAPTSEQIGEGLSDLLTFSVVEPADVTEARQVFELGIVPLVCRRADEQDIAELLEICDRAEALRKKERLYPVSLSAEFHVRVARATHNPALELLARTFHGPMLRSLMRAQEQDPHVGVKGAQEHRDFVAAVRMRDVAAATAVMTAHLARTAERLRPGG
ncbi:transcriptional regulator, GntR family [Pseudonocardia ammonioxydans]|uniref:Transcriptional regulator, GntR family n=1 Tax=Pseudonocardia ammonioxydans TaxID=260086 RepID=A0A1I5FWP1_PSUAM|nr:FadR/GntR family transcriptional regulator [Pseudonocardia ammonioxydans]SFO28238.1 transcriptional regulator, GntR family [Pseudonocardia ammonioxydans]